MKDQLKNLREAMDHTVFKDAPFNNKQKQLIREKVRKKKIFYFAPTAVLTLFVMTIVTVSLIYMQQEHSANYRAMDHDLEEISFFTDRNYRNSFNFHESQLFLHGDTIMAQFSTTLEPQIIKEPEMSYEYAVYDNITVTTTGNVYTIFSNNKFLMTLEKIAPRIVQDSKGNEYFSTSYLSKSYEIKFINESNVNFSTIELLTDEKNYVSSDSSSNHLTKNQSLSIDIPRERDTFHRTAKFVVAIVYLDPQGEQQRVYLKEPLILDNSYSDFYEMVLTGDSYDTLVLTLKEEAAE